jgi:hypothetical protein
MSNDSRFDQATITIRRDFVEACDGLDTGFTAQACRDMAAACQRCPTPAMKLTLMAMSMMHAITLAVQDEMAKTLEAGITRD